MLTPSGSTSPLKAYPAEESTLIFPHHVPLAFRPTNLQTDTSDQWVEPSALAKPGHHAQSSHQNLDLSSQLPPSSPIHSFSPTPSPSPRRQHEPTRKRVSPKKSNQTLKRQKSDAYNYFRSDPDDEWSTLPVRKKGKVPAQIKPKINGIKTTAAFRLPGSTTIGRVSGMGAMSERRIVTFLPPPLKSGKVAVVVEDADPRMREPDVDEALPRAPKHSRESSSPAATPKRRRLSENAYPTPANSRLTPGDAASSPRAALSPRPTIPASMHRIPSPPTSDPMPEYDADVRAAVIVGGVSERYSRTKLLMHQVRTNFI